MTDVEPVVTDFAASGRSGRRNALPDILGSPAGAGTSDLPHKLAELSVSEGNGCAFRKGHFYAVITLLFFEDFHHRAVLISILIFLSPFRIQFNLPKQLSRVSPDETS